LKCKQCVTVQLAVWHGRIAVMCCYQRIYGHVPELVSLESAEQCYDTIRVLASLLGRGEQVEWMAPRNHLRAACHMISIRVCAEQSWEVNTIHFDLTHQTSNKGRGSRVAFGVVR
jgi:hypothetical protein